MTKEQKYEVKKEGRDNKIKLMKRGNTVQKKEKSCNLKNCGGECSLFSISRVERVTTPRGTSMTFTRADQK
jgi:hypothetical protein